MRNNQRRFGKNNPQPSPAPATAGDLAFAVPTEFVELPSGGQYYPPNHPLHSQQHIEVRHMTAKEEDILTTQSYIKQGVVLDKLFSKAFFSSV